jgi:hypothetical protein
MIRNIYYSNFHSCLRYGIILWGGDSESNKIFKLKKKALRISGVSYHASCIQIFKDYITVVFFIHTRSDMFYKKFKNPMVKNMDIHNHNTQKKKNYMYNIVIQSSLRKV